MEESVIKHYFQVSDGYDCDFWMTTRTLSNEDLIQWLKRLDEIRTKDEFYPTDVLRKTETKRKKVYEMFDLINEIMRSRNK